MVLRCSWSPAARLGYTLGLYNNSCPAVVTNRLAHIRLFTFTTPFFFFHNSPSESTVCLSFRTPPLLLLAFRGSKWLVCWWVLCPVFNRNGFLFNLSRFTAI